MKRFLMTTALMVAPFGASALAAGKGDVEAGKAVFTARCRACHGSQGEGNPTIAKALKVTIPPLGSKEVQSKSEEALKKGIVEGSGKMKPVQGLSGKQIQDVIAFVQSLAKP